MPADPEVRAALERVVQTLQKLGAEIRDVSLPTLEEFAAVNRVILKSEAWAAGGCGSDPATTANWPGAGSWRARSWSRRLCAGVAPAARYDRGG